MDCVVMLWVAAQGWVPWQLPSFGQRCLPHAATKTSLSCTLLLAAACSKKSTDPLWQKPAVIFSGVLLMIRAVEVSCSYSLRQSAEGLHLHVHQDHSIQAGVPLPLPTNAFSLLH
jgi:hypothetical protein